MGAAGGGIRKNEEDGENAMSRKGRYAGYLCKYYKSAYPAPFGFCKHHKLARIGDCIDITPCKYFKRRAHRKMEEETK
jgi:hypothetical protein